MNTAAHIELRLTITKTGAVRYHYWPRRSFRTLPIARAEAEARMAAGTAHVYETCDYLTGDGTAVRTTSIAATEIQ